MKYSFDVSWMWVNDQQMYGQVFLQRGDAVRILFVFPVAHFLPVLLQLYPQIVHGFSKPKTKLFRFVQSARMSMSDGTRDPVTCNCLCH